jgi:CRISPR-associated endonuclease Csn1
MVMLYEKSPDEIWSGNLELMTKRLYKVVGLSSLRISKYVYGTINLLHHQEARQSKDLRFINGRYKVNQSFRSCISMLHGQIEALVEGYDFIINDLGEIKRLR